MTKQDEASYISIPKTDDSSRGGGKKKKKKKNELQQNHLKYLSFPQDVRTITIKAWASL